MSSRNDLSHRTGRPLPVSPLSKMLTWHGLHRWSARLRRFCRWRQAQHWRETGQPTPPPRLVSPWTSVDQFQQICLQLRQAMRLDILATAPTHRPLKYGRATWADHLPLSVAEYGHNSAVFGLTMSCKTWRRWGRVTGLRCRIKLLGNRPQEPCKHHTRESMGDGGRLCTRSCYMGPYNRNLRRKAGDQSVVPTPADLQSLLDRALLAAQDLEHGKIRSLLDFLVG